MSASDSTNSSSPTEDEKSFAKGPSETIQHLSEREEKAIIRRIDFCLLPLMFFSYLLQYLDKTTLSYASILGLLSGTVCSDPVCSSASALPDIISAHDHSSLLMDLECLLFRLPSRILPCIPGFSKISARQIPFYYDVR